MFGPDLQLTASLYEEIKAEIEIEDDSWRSTVGERYARFVAMRIARNLATLSRQLQMHNEAPIPAGLFRSVAESAKVYAAELNGASYCFEGQPLLDPLSCEIAMRLYARANTPSAPA